MHKRRQSVSERKSDQSWRRAGSTAAKSVPWSRGAYLSYCRYKPRHPSSTPWICQHDPNPMCWPSPSAQSDYDLLGEDSWWTRFSGRKQLFPLRQMLTATHLQGKSDLVTIAATLDTSGRVPTYHGVDESSNRRSRRRTRCRSVEEYPDNLSSSGS